MNMRQVETVRQVARMLRVMSRSIRRPTRLDKVTLAKIKSDRLYLLRLRLDQFPFPYVRVVLYLEVQVFVIVYFCDRTGSVDTIAT